MSDNDRATQAQELIERMQAARGYIYPEWELAANMDPDFTIPSPFRQDCLPG